MRGGNMNCNSFWNSSFGDMMATDFYQSIPLANIEETDTSYTYSLAIPGKSNSDFVVKVENTTLHILINEHKLEGKSYKRKEFDFGGSTRKFDLKDNVDLSSITAVYKNGILDITIHKKNVTQDYQNTHVMIN
jgi:HSP20 family protein